MSYQTPVPVNRSGNVWIDGLTDGNRWGTTEARPEVGFTFIGNTDNLPGGTFDGVRSLGWKQQEHQLILDGMRDIENVSGLRFVDRGDNSDAQVEIWLSTLNNKSANGSYGFAYTPGSDSDEGLVAINRSVYEQSDGSSKHSIARGSFYGITFLHELCHAVGLKHPHETGLFKQPRFPGLNRFSNEYRDKGLYNQNAHPFTQLSYVDKGARNGYVPESIQDYGFLKSLGALDVAALQWLYGVNAQHANKSNVYKLPLLNQQGTGWQAIWDTGGQDRIDGGKARVPVTIDLRNATLDESESAGGYISSVEGVYGGFTIAHDWNGSDFNQPPGLCIIEHASGGLSDDRLIGNNASNRLRGRRGNDVLYGGMGGDDVLIGGGGRDQFWIDVQPGSFATVKDFMPKRDQLVFSEINPLLSFENIGRDLFVRNNGVEVARLIGVESISPTRDVLFDGFDGV